MPAVVSGLVHSATGRHAGRDRQAAGAAGVFTAYTVTPSSCTSALHLTRWNRLVTMLSKFVSSNLHQDSGTIVKLLAPEFYI
jgi:hypothetical protein